MDTGPVHPVESNMALRFDNVSFSYDRVKVFENTSFHIHQGEFVALTGPNGTGKTTALKLLLGLENPEAGKIEIFGKSDKRQRERIGYVPQQAHLDGSFPITVNQVVRMGCLNPASRFFGGNDRIAVEEAMEKAEIADLALRPYNALSGGQRRRVLLARALASLFKWDRKTGQETKEPGLLVLDEPTANLDAESEYLLFMTLEKLKGNTTILIVTHDRDFVSSLVDRVLCMGGSHDASQPGGKYAVVQHRLRDSKILHDESFPADACYPNDSRCPEHKHD